MDPLQFGKVTIMQNNEPHRTPYVPTIKLLKRDPKDNTVSQEGMGDRKPSYKTLKQREAEYAEARKRILGDHSDSTSDPVEILSSSDTSPTLAPRWGHAYTPSNLRLVQGRCFLSELKIAVDAIFRICRRLCRCV